MKKLILIMLVVVVSFCTTSCGFLHSNTNNPTSNSIKESIQQSDDTTNSVNHSSSTTNDIDKVIDNLEIKTEVQSDGNCMAVFITNKNKVVIDELELDVNFYDSNDKIIDLEEDGHDMLLPDSTVVSRIEMPNNYNRFDTKVSVELGVHNSYENHSENVDLSYNFGEDCVIVQITNNANVKIDEVEFIVLLYSGDTLVLVEYPEDISDLESGDTETNKINTYGRQCDKAEVYLNQAHTFGL